MLISKTLMHLHAEHKAFRYIIDVIFILPFDQDDWVLDTVWQYDLDRALEPLQTRVTTIDCYKT